jgi:ribose transport system ATP-binding protein
VLRIEGLVKSFGGVRAVDGVSLELEPGTIHALLGGNGSGKSTTIKILAGVYQAESGTIEIGGDRFDARSFTPTQARDLGLRFVHQQQSTFPELTVAENLAVGRGFETGFGGRVRWRHQFRRAGQILERFGIDVDPSMPLEQYGVATHTMVAIARALQDVEPERPGVLVLDEPTAALPPAEVRTLVAELQRFASEGQTILYVTHRLEEVVELASRATVLRDGRVAGTLDAAEIDHESLVELIMGRKVQAALSHQAATAQGDVRLECKGLAGGPVRRADLRVCAGEIVAVAGLLGSGRSGLLRLILGDVGLDAGSVLVDGVEVAFSGPREASLKGLAYSPEDRLAAAAFLELSVRENIAIPSAGESVRGGRLRHRAERRDAAELLARYQVKAASPEMPLSALSGGNQQKALLVRWLRRNPRLLLLDEPTQGVDVGARAEIWNLVRDAVDRGAAALVVLSDYQELVDVCDRVILLSRGRTIRDITCDGLDDSTLEHLVLSANAQAVAA